MRRTATSSLSIFLILVLGVALVGCDSSPTSVQDFEVQPNLEASSNSLSLVLAQGNTSFQTSYQGLDSHPQAEGTGGLSLEKSNESGTPEDGSQEWSVGYTESPDGVVQENIILRSAGGGGEVVDTLSVTVSRFIVRSSFSNTSAVIADYEGSQRSLSTTGGTSAAFDSTVVSQNSAGVASLMIEGSPNGSATISRRTNAPDSDRFSFLVHPDPSTSFTLTLTFTEETGGGTTTHEVDVPVEAGDQWLEYGIAFSQIGDDFNPVASRSGGNGPFVSVEMSADANATYYVDGLSFDSGDRMVAEIHDFDRTSFEYSCVTLSTSNDVADASDGFNSREIDGSGCFGYNYATLRADLSPDGVISARVNASEGDELYIFLETRNGNAGGYEYGNGTTVTLPTGGRQTIAGTASNPGDDVAALQDPGLQNIGLESTQGNTSTFLIDDIRLREPSN